jgi:hypothetical protein
MAALFRTICLPQLIAFSLYQRTRLKTYCLCLVSRTAASMVTSSDLFLFQQILLNTILFTLTSLLTTSTECEFICFVTVRVSLSLTWPKRLANICQNRCSLNPEITSGTGFSCVRLCTMKLYQFLRRQPVDATENRKLYSWSVDCLSCCK